MNHEGAKYTKEEGRRKKEEREKKHINCFPTPRFLFLLLLLYRELHKKMFQSCGMGILPVLVLLAAKMPAPQKNLGYFFIWKFHTLIITNSVLN
ncbi:hypothetical protein MEO40_15590 [Dolichospermum sp. ST_sed1]|nr:hypothetical protein [Dolichospermum sp. ST_sed1]MDD1439839.1 hypothetical protein [Dolichospermum sp. ST_sed3]